MIGVLYLLYVYIPVLCSSSRRLPFMYTYIVYRSESFTESQNRISPILQKNHLITLSFLRIMVIVLQNQVDDRLVLQKNPVSIILSKNHNDSFGESTCLNDI